jgi:hypothetical protein
MEKAQPMNLISSGDITQVRSALGRRLTYDHRVTDRYLPLSPSLAWQEEMGLWMRALGKAEVLAPRKSKLAKQRVKWAEIKRRAVTDVSPQAGTKDR